MAMMAMMMMMMMMIRKTARDRRIPWALTRYCQRVRGLGGLSCAAFAASCRSSGGRLSDDGRRFKEIATALSM